MDQAKKTLVNPETNVYNLSGKTHPKTSGFVAKIYLKKFDVVEIHALGETISKAVRVAEQLQRQNYVTIEKINTFTQKFDDDRQKVKIVVTIKQIIQSNIIFVFFLNQLIFRITIMSLLILNYTKVFLLQKKFSISCTLKVTADGKKRVNEEIKQ